MTTKKCFYCGEEYDESLFFNFTVQNTSTGNRDVSYDSGECCADCIATWFSETPEDVQNMMIWRN